MKIVSQLGKADPVRADNIGILCVRVIIRQMWRIGVLLQAKYRLACGIKSLSYETK